jgi:iron complex outermembrane receptor protein
VVGPSFAGQSWSEFYYNEGDFTNYGVYGDIDFQFDERWSALFGLRYSWDDKDFSWRNPPNTLNAVRPGTEDLVFVPYAGYEEARTGTLTASDDWSQLTGRAVVNYQINDEVLTFLSYSTGYKSGAFDSLDPRTSDNPLQPEESENLEWGIKGTLFGSRLATELSVFNMNLDGRQRTVDSKPPEQAQAVPKVITGDQEFTGMEIILNWLISDNFQLGFLTTWRETDSEWEPFYNAEGDLVTETTSDTSDTDYTFTFDWFPQIASGDLALRLEYVFFENNDEADPAVLDPGVPGFGEDRKLLNARAAWTTQSGHWTFGLWGKNLLDNEVTSGINDITTASFGTPFVTIDPPRTYGVEAAYNF